MDESFHVYECVMSHWQVDKIEGSLLLVHGLIDENVVCVATVCCSRVLQSCVAVVCCSSKLVCCSAACAQTHRRECGVCCSSVLQ